MIEFTDSDLFEIMRALDEAQALGKPLLWLQEARIRLAALIWEELRDPHRPIIHEQHSSRTQPN